jgi:hypothetical protein
MRILGRQPGAIYFGKPQNGSLLLILCIWLSPVLTIFYLFLLDTKVDTRNLIPLPAGDDVRLFASGNWPLG